MVAKKIMQTFRILIKDGSCYKHVKDWWETTNGLTHFKLYREKKTSSVFTETIQEIISENDDGEPIRKPTGMPFRISSLSY